MPLIPDESGGEREGEKPDVRLAYSGQIMGTIRGLEGPTVRPAMTNDGMPSKQSRYPVALGKKEIRQPLEGEGPTVRLALSNSPPERNGSLDAPTVRLVGQTDRGLNTSVFPTAFSDVENAPALLVSYVYLDKFLTNRARYHYRDWVLDSGAFSAHNSGTVIRLQEYIACCKKLMTEDKKLVEVFALDVIGDWKTSVKNCERMWQQGVPAIPTFHYGSPWEVLLGLAKDYPKVAIGGCVGKRNKDKFAGQCFARIWPKRIHGFGFGSEKSLMAFPWHSVDATSWETGPCKFGNWKAFGRARISVRGSQQNLRAEVEWYLDLERRARNRWRKEMTKLQEVGPSLRFAINGRGQGEVNGALGPVVRLVVGAGRSSSETNTKTGLEKESS